MIKTQFSSADVLQRMTERFKESSNTEFTISFGPSVMDKLSPDNALDLEQRMIQCIGIMNDWKHGKDKK